MSKVVTYTSSTYLPCACNADNEIVICLNSADLVAPKVCPGAPLVADEDFPFTTIDASITQFLKLNNGCGSPVYQYSLTYDETQLADPTTPIIASQITGVFCKNCLTNWAEEAIGNESYIKDNGDGTVSYVSPHNCEYQIVTASTIDEVSKLLCNTVSPQTYSELLTDVAAGHNICICVPLTLTGNLTLSVGLSFSLGGKLTTNGFTLTINGPFTAGVQQCFDATSGSVVFGTNSTDYIIPEWWGAKIGNADDVTPITKALANSTGKDFILGPGQYNISTPIQAAANSRILGTGYNQTILHQITANTSILNVSNDNEIAFIKFSGTGNLNVLGNQAIFFDAVGSGTTGKRVHVHDCYFDNTLSTSAIGGNNLIDVIIENNIIDLGTQGEHAIYVSGGSNRVFVLNNTINRTGAPAVASLRALHLKGGSNCVFDGNYVYGSWNAYGFISNTLPATNIQVTNNTFIFADTSNLKAIATGQACQDDQFLIANNYISGSIYGIWCQSKNTTIEGNFITGTGQRGIECDGTTNDMSNLTLQGNVMYNCVEGIRIVNADPNYNVNGNTFNGGAASAGLGMYITSGSTSGVFQNNVVVGALGGAYSFSSIPAKWNNIGDGIINSGATSGIVAGGTIISDAVVLGSYFNKVTTVAAGTGVKLWNVAIGMKVSIWSTGANNLNVWPPDGSTSLNGGANGAAAVQAPNTMTDWWRITATTWVGVEYTVAVA